jgi:hypothetical protein
MKPNAVVIIAAKHAQKSLRSCRSFIEWCSAKMAEGKENGRNSRPRDPRKQNEYIHGRADVNQGEMPDLGNFSSPAFVQSAFSEAVSQIAQSFGQGDA